MSSVFANLRQLLPKPALLGARATFAWPKEAMPLTEFSLPLSPRGYAATLERRTGVVLRWHRGESLYDHLASGRGAVVVVDSHHLPYRPAFGRVHSHRTILVRPSNAAGCVEVDDPWPPAFRGPLPIADLERARFADVPLDPLLEPVFAGQPVSGEWLSASITAPSIDDETLLAELAGDLAACGEDDEGRFGLGAMRAFALSLASDTTVETARRASLLLRAEHASRVQLCALLRAASEWLGAPPLRRIADRYQQRLRAMELARDVLTKSLRHPRMEYRRFVLDRLSDAADAEEQLLAELEERSRRKWRTPPQSSSLPMAAIPTAS